MSSLQNKLDGSNGDKLNKLVQQTSIHVGIQGGVVEQFYEEQSSNEEEEKGQNRSNPFTNNNHTISLLNQRQ